MGRYREDRHAGEDRESAFYTMYRGTAHVILGSGLTIAAATFCLAFARMPYFQTLGIPCAVGMLVAVVVALTLGPAVVTVGGRFGAFDPKRRWSVRGWRRVGTAVVRWPLPILLATCAIALIGLISLTGYKPSYDDRAYLPKSIPANQGFAAADRHFSQDSPMNPEILMMKPSDHDLRNPADFLILDKLAKGIFRVPGISRVQAITRPQGTTMDHTSIPFQISMQNAAQVQQHEEFQARPGWTTMLTQAGELDKTIATMQRLYGVTAQLVATTHRMVGDHRADTADHRRATRPRSFANFDDFCGGPSVPISIGKSIASTFRFVGRWRVDFRRARRR